VLLQSGFRVLSGGQELRARSCRFPSMAALSSLTGRRCDRYFLRDWWAAGVARVTDARPSAQPPPPQTPQTHTRTQTQTPPREPPPPAPTAAAVVLRPAAAAVLHKSSGPASGGAAVTGVTPGAAAAMKDVDTRVRALGFGSLEELLMSLEGRRASC